jgi:hypothetical protein
MGLDENSFVYNDSNVRATFKVTDGKLVIVKSDISDDENFTVSDPADVTYTGKEQKQPVTVTDKNGKTLAEGTDVKVTYSDDTTNAGTVTVTITGNGGYTGTVTKTYKINPAELTVTTGSATKTYDGTALTSSEASISGLVNGETATITATGTQTAVGSSDNTYTIAWNGTAKESNYKIVTETLGTLTVTTAPTPTPAPPAPTPDPGPGPGPGPDPEPAIVNPPVIPVNPPVVPVEPEPEIVPDEPVPQASPTATPEEIIDPEPPLTPPATWAVLNLVSSILTTLIGLGMVITYFRKKKEDDEDEDGVVRQNTDEEEDDKNKRKASKFLGLIPAIGSIVLFILTEDMSNVPAWTDKWTLWMAVILLVNVILAFATRNPKDDDDEEEEAAA